MFNMYYCLLLAGILSGLLLVGTTFNAMLYSTLLSLFNLSSFPMPCTLLYILLSVFSICSNQLSVGTLLVLDPLVLFKFFNGFALCQ